MDGAGWDKMFNPTLGWRPTWKIALMEDDLEIARDAQNWLSNNSRSNLLEHKTIWNRFKKWKQNPWNSQRSAKLECTARLSPLSHSLFIFIFCKKDYFSYESPAIQKFCKVPELSKYASTLKGMTHIIYNFVSLLC